MKIAYIIAFQNFRDEEYFVPKEVFENQGIQVSTFSTVMGNALGSMGGEVEIDGVLADINIDLFDAVLLAGGPGAKEYTENEECLEIIREARNKGKLIGAICIAPTILAAAGVLRGETATVWTSTMDKSAIQYIEDQGANFIDEDVVVSGKIITASGPDAARKFAQTIIENL